MNIKFSPNQVKETLMRINSIVSTWFFYRSPIHRMWIIGVDNNQKKIYKFMYLIIKLFLGKEYILSYVFRRLEQYSVNGN